MTNYATDRRVTGFKVLDCKFIREAMQFPWVGCCPSCHKKEDQRIIVRPTIDEGPEEGMVDWFLGIEASVCCKLYDYVRALQYQWWVDRALEFGTTRVDDRNREVKPYVRPERTESSGPRKTQAKRRAILDDAEREKTGGLAGFLKR